MIVEQKKDSKIAKQQNRDMLVLRTAHGPMGGTQCYQDGDCTLWDLNARMDSYKI
jgi:hypothetical protein